MLLPVLIYPIVNTEALRNFNHVMGLGQNFDLTLNLDRGNKHKSGADLAYRLDYKESHYSYFFVLNYSLDKDKGDIDVNKGFIHGRFVLAMPSLCHEYFIQEEYDANIDLRYRRLAGLGARFYIFDSAIYQLYGGIGVFVEEEAYDELDQKVNTRLSTYLSTTKRVSSAFQYTNTSYFQPAFSDVRNFRIFSVHDFSYQVSEFLSLSFDLTFKFDNKPYNNSLKKEDIGFNQRFSFSF